MKWLLRISFGFLVACLITLVVLVVLKFKNIPAVISTADVTPFIVMAGVLIALATLIINQRRVASEEYLENATDLLSKAYEILSETKDGQGVPKNSRINWLTAARLIRTAESIAELLTEESHKRIWREKKEYWRGRLRDLINPNNDGFVKGYYAATPELMLVYGDHDPVPLSERSLAVLYRFVRWPKGSEDPLKNESIFSDAEIDEMVLLGPKQLGQLLKEVRQIN